MMDLLRTMVPPCAGRWLTGAGLLAGLLGSGLASAQVMIRPVVLELGARQRVMAVTVSLSDQADAPVRLQAQVLRWRQDVQGHAVTEPSDDLLVSPPIADVKPGEKQVFRVALRGARPAPEELSYRLILEDVSAPTTANRAAAVQFQMRYDLPVLVAPVAPVVTALRWKPCPPEAAKQTPAQTASGVEACVRLLNAGNRRVKVQTLTLAGDNGPQVLSLQEGQNVLSGAEREWRVPLSAARSGVVRGVKVDTALGETLQAEAGGF
jgi:fimbrial chaperone protein